MLNILNLIDLYNTSTPSSGVEDDKPDDYSALAADVQKAAYQGRTSNDGKFVVGGNLTSGWLKQMKALSKTNMLRWEFKVCGQIGKSDQRDNRPDVSSKHQI